MKSNYAFCLVLAFVAASASQNSNQAKGRPKQYIETVKLRPDLGAEYSQAASIKLASRKSSYRVGEMISVDVAFLNRSSSRTSLA